MHAELQAAATRDDHTLPKSNRLWPAPLQRRLHVGLPTVVKRPTRNSNALRRMVCRRDAAAWGTPLASELMLCG